MVLIRKQVQQWNHLGEINNMNSMYLYGASGHAKVIIDILKSKGVEILGLFDDNPNIKSLLCYPVVGNYSPDILKKNSLIITIGVNDTRQKIVNSLPSNINYGIAVDASALISASVKIGCGTVIMQGTVIQSTSVIGRHCIVNTQASLDHDCVVEDYAHISPNSCLCGGVTIGEGTQVGAGSVIVPGIKVGKWSVVGAGSVVIRDVPDNVLVLGNPAKIVKNIF